MASYEPGVCNIGRTEQRRRRYLGYAAFVAAGSWTAWLLLTDGPPQYFAVTFLLLVGGFVGYLQARLQFCIAFASMARYELSDVGGGAGSVTDSEQRWADRKRALEILVYAIALGAAMTLLVYGFDLFVVNPPRG